MFDKLSSIIKKHFDVISQVVTGKPASKELLKKLNIDNKTNLISEAYQYGKSQFSQLPLTVNQKQLLEQAKQKAQQTLDVVTQKVIASVNTLLSNRQANKLRTKSNNPIKTDLEKAVNTTQIKSDIKRITQTELWDAKTKGNVDAILENKGSETKVRVIPHPDACPQCKRLYLDGNTPKTFTVSQLLANGKNNGLKADDWLAVLPPCHPHCRCTLEQVK